MGLSCLSKGLRSKTWARYLALLFTLTESAIGAALVLLRLVGSNESPLAWALARRASDKTLSSCWAALAFTASQAHF